jgi:mono/diheme cytochrome c family protein
MFRAVKQRHFAFLAFALLACAGCSRSAGSSESHEQQVAQGRDLYDTNGCATCHGPAGRGDGPVGKILHISPRDLHDAAAFVNGYDVQRIARTIGAGLVRGNQSMPAYAHLSSQDRELLAVFIMSLRDDSQKESKQQ